MATPAKRSDRSDRSDSSSHQDVDTLTSSAVADPHALAFAERQRDPGRYDDPRIATPGVLDDIDEDAPVGMRALVDADSPSGLDVGVDNRDQVQPMLDRLAESIREESDLSTGVAVAATNPHESDAVDVESLQADQDKAREDQRDARQEQRDRAREANEQQQNK